MAAPSAVRRNRRRHAKPLTVAAPVGGWNARDSLDKMDPSDAIQLENWIPDLGSVRLREGYTPHSTGMGSAAVETVAEYHAETTRTLIAAASGEIWDATTDPASSLASGFSSDRWQTVNFNGSMGLVNGEDAPQVYDGSTVSAMTVSGPTDVKELVGVNVFKSRTYFWENFSQDFWYSAVNALGGVLTNFPLSRVGQFGGNLIAMVSWSRQGLGDLDALAAFIMSSGEIIVYTGSNPGDTNDWALVGVFKVGSPVGVRSVLKLNGDVVVITTEGYISLNQVVRAGRLNDKALVSNKIADAAIKQVAASGDQFGWSAVTHPAKNLVLFNYPTESAGIYEQHVLNSQTGAWCKFRNIPALQFVLFDKELYFAGPDGTVFQALSGNSDDGENIVGVAMPAFNYLGSRTSRKRVTAVKPLVASAGTLVTAITLNSDFSSNTVKVAPSVIDPSGSEWNEAIWNVSPWATPNTVRGEWFIRSKLGYSFSLGLSVNTKNQGIKWFSYIYAYETGGII